MYLPIVLAFVGDSTMTSAPPFAGAASVVSVSAGGFSAAFRRGARFFFGITSSSLSVTYQPRFNRSGLLLYQPALVCASLTTSAATISALFASVSTVAFALA